MKDIQRLLVEEDEKEAAAGTPSLLEMSPNEFLVVGLELEEDQ